jgi:hypothetical protein
MLTDIITQNKPYSQSTGLFKSDLQQGWYEFIKRFDPYTWFNTLTFAQEIHPEQANKRFKRFIGYLNTELYGKRYKKHQKGVTWFKAIEYQKRGVLHFHCLIGSPELYKLYRKKYEWAWRSNCTFSEGLVNGYAQINKYDVKRGAVSYCSKYVGKGGEIDCFITPALYKQIKNKEQLKLKFVNEKITSGDPGNK